MIIARWMLVTGMLLLANCFAQAATAFPLAGAAALAAACFSMAKAARKRLTTLGSARWADAEDVRKAGMHDAKGGIILGRLADSQRHFLPALAALLNPRLNSLMACRQFLGALRRAHGKLLVMLNAVHVAIFAPTGGGKGVSIVAPYLLTCDESCVVLDFKGELAQLTGAQRRAMGHDVRIIDPYRIVTNSPDTLNPLDMIDKDSPLAIDECRDFANALVLRTGEEKDPHWCDSAEFVIGAFIAAVAYFGEPGYRSLQTVRTLLSNPEKMEALIRKMREAPQAWSGMLARMGNQLMRYKDNELGSVLTTVNRFMTFLDTIAIDQTTKESTFDPADLVKSKMTVYLVLPPEHIRSQQGFLRLYIGMMLRACVKGGLQEKRRVHFVLDEAASLGHMTAIDDALDKYRAYGVRLQFYFQSVGQLKKCFPDGQDQTFLSNCSQVFFGVNDKDTAQYVSDRLGEETIVVTSGGTSKSTTYQGAVMGPPTESRSFQRSDNWSQVARRLLKPEEVANLSGREAITFTPGIPPLRTTLIRYYEENVRSRPRIWEKAAILAWSAFLLAISLAGLGWVSDNVPSPQTDSQATTEHGRRLGTHSRISSRRQPREPIADSDTE